MNDTLQPNHGTRVNIVTRRMAHHASHSGYDRLADYLDGCVALKYPEQLTLGQRVVGKILSPLIQRSNSQWYHRDSLILELQAARRCLTARGELFHFLYAENSFRYFGVCKRLNAKNRIVCTYHTPPDKFQQVVKDRRSLLDIDALIIVSTMQRDCFASLVGEERVHYVPHGVDVDYFVPLAERAFEAERCRCLLVGSHLRDFDVLVRAVRLLNARHCPIDFDVVTLPAYHHLFQGIENVHIHARLSDADLLTLYQRADMFVLPLTDCTANNVLLEAMACGVPIVATDLQGVRDYVDDACAVLTTKGDAHMLADALARLAADAERRRHMALASRARALSFRWETVAERMRNIYMEL